MSFWSRITNVFRGDSLNREIDEEMNAHLEEAIERGIAPAEARKAFGSLLRQRESSRDIRIAGWLESVFADTVFGWRQLLKGKATSAAAILSLALAIGACTSVFRVIDALLLRPLPVASPERLYVLVHQGIDFDGSFQKSDFWIYPLFQQMRAAVMGEAEIIAISESMRTEITYGSDQDMENAYVQYVSGSMFRSMGIRPALGRLLLSSDDSKPLISPVAVLSYDYWTRRLARDKGIAGRSLKIGTVVYTIVGVAAEGFTGIEPGIMTDIFVPTMMNANVQRSDFYWIRTLVLPTPGVSGESVRQRLHAVYRSFQVEHLKSLTGFPQSTLDGIVNQQIMLERASAGVSDLQDKYQQPLTVLAALVLLVLLIACANVANLLTAQAAARGREMALRVSIGAGRSRLVQLVLTQAAIIALFASAIGATFAWWSAPFLVSHIHPPGSPARLILLADWRVFGFFVTLTFLVTLSFGLGPAIRASLLQPSVALKGGDDPLSRRRIMHILIAGQVAFSCFAIFVSGLLVTTLNRLADQPTGFASQRLLTMDAVADPALAPGLWNQVAQRLQSVPGVESAAMADWPLLSENVRGGYVSVGSGKPFPEPAYFLKISPRWLDIMTIPLVGGRDFRDNDVFPRVAIINEAFARKYFQGVQPLGRSFTTSLADKKVELSIIGVVRNARYADLRGSMPPVIYFPFQYIDDNGKILPRSSGTFVIRTDYADPLRLASELRLAIRQSGTGLRVTNIRTQAEINALHTFRERLVALLGVFFAFVALFLTGVGVYGVLAYSVVQRQREIGIRIALGAKPADLVRHITLGIFSMVTIGATLGICAGLAAARILGDLMYKVRVTELNVISIPFFFILCAAMIAALPPLIRALRIDPANTLRCE